MSAFCFLNLSHGGIRTSFQPLGWRAKWKNPYITDGLVAMWDGEWNVGGGKHDNNQTNYWIDCVNGKVITFQPNTSIYQSHTNYNITVRSKYITLTQANAVLHNQDDINEIGNTLQSNPITIEYILTSKTPNKDRSYVFDQIWQNGGYYIVIQAGIGGLIQRSMNNTKIDETVHTTTFVIEGFNNKGYKNGQLKYTTTVEETATFAYTGVVLGNNYDWGDFTIYGDVMSIRLYNRALSEQEIMENYAIDKKRFGIEDNQ